MLHELILALNGYSGQLFHFNGSAFQIEMDLKIQLLHSSERMVLNEILEIATHYKQLQSFIESKKHRANSVLSTSTVIHGSEYSTESYITAICVGITSVFKTYSNLIDDLEWKVLNDPFITFSHVKSIFEPYRELFRMLHIFIDRVKSEKSSCLVVEILKSVFDSNIHKQDQLMHLVIPANDTLYKHITDWVVFGCLPNPNSEFFVQLNKEQPEGLESTITIRSRTRNTKKKTSRYFINYTLVPTYFSIQLVERILFMGNSILVLGKSDKTRAGLAGKQQEFFSRMQRLPRNTFRTDSLSETMEELTCAVGKDLHHLVVSETDLLTHLSIIKDFFLGGRGELFHEFQSIISQNLSKKTSMMDLKMLPTKNVRLNIKECFRLASSRVQVQEHILQKIEVIVTATDSGKADAMEKYLSEIGLNLKQEWPLHILFTQESMDGYNEMFRFLLQVRGLQMQLKLIWLETRQIFRVPIPNGPAILRIQMTYFIDNFQYYLQADVLESQYGILIEGIEKSETFDHIRLCLSKFQSNIMVQSFRTNPSLRDGIQQLMDLCTSYCKHMNYLIQQYHEHGIPVCEGRSSTIDEFTTNFHRKVEFLYAAFRRLAGDPQFGVYLGQLLLRLDYNSYFSKYRSMSLSQHPSIIGSLT